VRRIGSYIPGTNWCSGASLTHVGDSVEAYINSLCFSNNGRNLATAGDDKLIRLWSLKTHRVIRTFPGHEDSVSSIDISRDQTMLASVSEDHTLRLWDIRSTQQLRSFSDIDGCASVVFSPDGRLVATGLMDRSLGVWSTDSGAMVARLDGHCDRTFGIVFASSGEEIVSSSIDGTVSVWGIDSLETDTLQNSTNVKSPGKKYDSKLLVGHRNSVYCVAITPDGRHAVTGSRDLGVRFWDLNTGRTDIQLYGHRDSGKSKNYPRFGLICFSHRHNHGT
jgi:glucose repression regulatory protein TUP1